MKRGAPLDTKDDKNTVVNSILTFINEGKTEEAVASINQTSTEDLNSVLELQLPEFISKTTTLLCEAAVKKNIPVIKALLEKKVELNVKFVKTIADPKFFFGPLEYDETIFSRMIDVKDFDEETAVVGKLLIENGVQLLLSEESILFHFYNRNSQNNNIIEKYKVLMGMMGNKFYEHLLYSKQEYKITPLCQLEREHKECVDTGRTFPLFDFVLNATLSYFGDDQKKLSEELLTKLLITTNFNNHVIGFVRSHLKKIETDTHSEQKILESELVETKYESQEAYFNSKFPLFTYQNEKEAFLHGLRNAILSWSLINEIHRKSILSTERQETSWGATSVTASGKDKLKALLELEDCRNQHGWFELVKNRNSDSCYEYRMSYHAGDLNKLDKLITEYNVDIKKLFSRVDILKRIIKFSSDLTRMHYFCDANKRTAFIVLNMELHKFGFLPAMLKNRHILRYSDQDEIYREILKGMQECREHMRCSSQDEAIPLLNGIEGCLNHLNKLIALAQGSNNATIHKTSEPLKQASEAMNKAAETIRLSLPSKQFTVSYHQQQHMFASPLSTPPNLQTNQNRKLPFHQY